MINIAICDDSKDFLEIIEYKVEQCLKNKFDLECRIGYFDQLEALSDYLKRNRVDIVFLDIMVNDINAMDWSIENIHSHYTQIIFMTAFPQCAYNISESNCCYYLVKSKITEETLTKALQRALQRVTSKNPNMINIQMGSKRVSVNQQDIMYIETFSNNILLHMRENDSISIYSSLKDFSDNLSPNFLRCHKSFMVNMNYIIGYQPHIFILKSNETIPIPPKKYKMVTQAYNNYLKNI